MSYNVMKDPSCLAWIAICRSYLIHRAVYDDFFLHFSLTRKLPCLQQRRHSLRFHFFALNELFEPIALKRLRLLLYAFDATATGIMSTEAT